MRACSPGKSKNLPSIGITIIFYSFVTYVYIYMYVYTFSPHYFCFVFFNCVCFYTQVIRWHVELHAPDRYTIDSRFLRSHLRSMCISIRHVYIGDWQYIAINNRTVIGGPGGKEEIEKKKKKLHVVTCTRLPPPPPAHQSDSLG